MPTATLTPRTPTDPTPPARPTGDVLLEKGYDALKDTLEDCELVFEAFHWGGRMDLARDAMRLLEAARRLEEKVRAEVPANGQ
jgi:hypothetical protein